MIQDMGVCVGKGKLATSLHKLHKGFILYHKINSIGKCVRNYEINYLKFTLAIRLMITTTFVKFTV